MARKEIFSASDSPLKESANSILTIFQQKSESGGKISGQVTTQISLRCKKRSIEINCSSAPKKSGPKLRTPTPENHSRTRINFIVMKSFYGWRWTSSTRCVRRKSDPTDGAIKTMATTTDARVVVVRRSGDALLVRLVDALSRVEEALGVGADQMVATVHLRGPGVLRVLRHGADRLAAHLIGDVHDPQQQRRRVEGHYRIGAGVDQGHGLEEQVRQLPRPPRRV